MMNSIFAPWKWQVKWLDELTYINWIEWNQMKFNEFPVFITIWLFFYSIPYFLIVKQTNRKIYCLADCDHIYIDSCCSILSSFLVQKETLRMRWPNMKWSSRKDDAQNTHYEKDNNDHHDSNEGSETIQTWIKLKMKMMSKK